MTRKRIDGSMPAPLPRGANHVAVAADAGRIYALGGFIEQNRNPDNNAYAYDVGGGPMELDRVPCRARAAPLRRSPLSGKIHLSAAPVRPRRNGRASAGMRSMIRRRTNGRRERRRPARATMSARVAHDGVIHIIGGRFNTFEYNTNLHHGYLPERDTWEERSPMPTARSGHGLVVYRRPPVRHGRRGRHPQQRACRSRPRCSGRRRATIRRRTPGSSTRRCRPRAMRWGRPCSATGSMLPAAAPCSAARCNRRSMRPSRWIEITRRRWRDRKAQSGLKLYRPDGVIRADRTSDPCWSMF